MRLQLALDGPLAESLRILAAVRPYIDIAEAGTPLVLREGCHALRQIRSRFPDVTLLADFKIMDAGELEAGIAFEAGANMVSVLGVAPDATISGAAAAARRSGGTIMIDLMQVADPLVRARQCLALGCDYFCVHTAHDAGSESPLNLMRPLRNQLPGVRLAAAGGINLTNIDSIAAFRPATIVVGSAITGADDPAAAAKALRERMDAYA
jgi:3-hexulose-6-phosphate synthase